MPIRPELMPLYPGGSIRSQEWLSLRAKVLRRARYRCQDCGVLDRTIIFRFRDDHLPYDRKTIDLWGHRHAPSQVELLTVFLTVAHLDHDPTNNSFRNLRVLCGGCHLRHDLEHHIESRRRSYAAGDLFDGPYMLPHRHLRADSQACSAISTRR
jgi:5-methylcytosine-specific restriction endonuclease McrA